METTIITIGKEFDNKFMSCCGKNWKFEYAQSLINFNGDTLNACCKVCGHFITIIEDILDDEELDNIKEG